MFVEIVYIIHIYDDIYILDASVKVIHSLAVCKIHYYKIILVILILAWSPFC